MTRKRIPFAITFVLTGLLSGCVQPRDTVRVSDKLSRSPIPGALVVPTYLSVNGTARRTNSRGVAGIGGFGLSSLYSLEVSAPGYERLSVPLPKKDVNHLEVSLQPASKP